MDNRKQALTDLLAKVEAGRVEGPNFMDVCVALGFKQEFVYTWKAAQESLDAAKALHDAVLPNESWMVRWVSKYPNLFGSCGGSHQAKVGWGEEHIAYSDNPARAWLIAIIKALIAKADA